MALPPIPPRSRNIRNVPAPSDAPAQLATLSTPPVIEHNAKSAKDDGIDSTLVQPSEWNEAHKMTLPGGSVIGRDPSGAGPAQSFPLDSEASDAFHIPTTDYVTKAVQDAVDAALAKFEGSVAVTGDITASVIWNKAGWLQMIGQTIGNTGSGAVNAGPAYHDLFVLFWSNINGVDWPINGGRGTSAEADWNANKTIPLPDARGRVLGMVDEGMGVNTLLNIIGAKGGEQNHILNNNEMAPHNHAVQIPSGAFNGHGGGGYVGGGSLGDFAPVSISNDQGGGQAHNNVQPTLAIIYHIKL
jgi:hypothetical protein